ncbi:MinD/ParA family protein [Clostridium ganghwense]|uniref:MinD/ParA family protein n=1 Tax=Clostridium ganghwense TaxID=312089 RepID=A0ABT4CMT4_9CLOT|nr:MinD/ParA family protein [Clostridium ganghwense]MCY6370373.1 MinD/ParA family protein [Clostridium ganghwense]
MLDQAERLRKLAEKRDLETLNQDSPIRSTSHSNACKIITVTSGKGGVGKSNFVVNLGITLQKMGKSVLIFDADVGMGNDDVLMGFLPKYNIYDIIFNEMKIEEVMIEGPFGIKLLPGGSGINRIEEISEVHRKKFLNKLASLEGFDYILMDTGAGINRSVLGFIHCSDELIIITTPEPTSLTDAYSLMKAVTHFKIKSNAKVIINRVLDNREGKVTFDKFNNAAEKFLNLNLQYLGSINEDRRLIQAVREQKPFVVTYPNCEAAQDIRKVALSLCGSDNGSNRNGIQGLFKKIFSVFS